MRWRRRAAWAVLVFAGLPMIAEAGDEPLRVGSKAFTESVILGEVVALTAEATGAAVEHRRALGGTRILWNALLAGEIDVYPEYTGTIAQEILAAQRPVAARSDDWIRPALEEREVAMIGPLGFDNTYALGMREDVAAVRGLRDISGLRRHPDLRFGFSNEFMSRQDGWPALRNRYGLTQENVRGLDHDIAYRGLAHGTIEVTDLYSTDAEIRYYGLRVLRDDLAHFPRYEAVLLYRRALESRRPELVRALKRLAGRIDAATMIDMNARAKLDKTPERVVAADLVKAVFGARSVAERPGRTRSILRRTTEHVQLVALSLVAAIATAVPLGIVAWRRPRVGQLVLAAVGLVQTIPSLALLVFMIPLLGIGAAPAIAALFLYSLLPIVRNTHAGLAGIAPDVRESAEALGLPTRAILRLVELPLASRSILAGIKSAAIINVGTATLGALVGAGGFGQPIFAGVRLDDVGLILEGAIPASLLALGVQASFDALERVVVPRGLRLERPKMP